MIEVEELAFAFESEPVLEDVSLTVEPGELVGLIGPNGAGKTTLLRHIGGVLTPDAGRVIVGGDPVASLSARELGRRVAVVPQQLSLSFDFSIREVVAMGRHPYQGRFDRRDRADRARVDAAMASTDIEDLADRPFSEVSGGERKRILIARAIAQDTPGLLVDEPTASLDINHQVAVFELLRDLVSDDKAVLAAVHDLDLAARYCDRLLLLGDGSITAAGSAESVLSSETLRSAYGIETTVVDNPVTDTPTVVAHRRDDGPAPG